MGDRVYYIKTAFSELKKAFSPYSATLQVAPIYESKPMYNTMQPDYLNTVFQCFFPSDTCLTPQQLLEITLETENRLGRVRDSTITKGPRTIDLDILLFGSIIMETDKLIIPHPLLKERYFVLTPLLQLDNTLKDPISGIKYSTIAGKLPDQGVICFSV